jgi:hypothetical protein
MEWSGRAPAPPAMNAGRGTEDKEHAMPQKLVTSPAVIGSFSTGSTGIICRLMAALCRSIVEAHGGRIWAAPGMILGVALHIMLPTLGDDRPE